MKNIQEAAWEATQALCASLDLETAMSGFFRCLREEMPIKDIFLGRFDDKEQHVFVISHTDSQGTARIFQAFPFSAEQKKRAAQLGFFNTANVHDDMVDSPGHPLAPLFVYDGLAVTFPCYVHRLVHENAIYGGANFSFDEGTVVTERMTGIIRSLEAPLSIFINAWFQYWNLQQLKDQIYRENHSLRQKLSGLEPGNMIGASGGLSTLTGMMRQVAPLDVAVLLRGETGTGKEVAALALHRMSPQKNGPFVAVNCGAIPGTLIDSQLFGHARGAFTHAIASHKGFFEQAEGGTLFLDEVAELPLDVQARLLRVLQERVVQPIGGKPVPVHFRLIAATHRDLERMISEGTFRDDLYYRLRVVSLRIPPLRERREDIALLARHFLEQEANRFGVLAPALSDADLRDLTAYAWPGNVRELRNVVAEALALSGGGPLRFRLGGGMEEPGTMPFSADAPGAHSAPKPWDETIRDYLARALEHCGGKIRGPGGAAELLGINYSTLREKLRKYNVPHGKQRRAGRAG